jgi:pseudaminic acid cytidylyltransferase
MKKKIAIIPARGGSKRIPRKNIKLFLDKPIIAYSIEAALKSELFDEVMVSTDDPEIAKIALSYGAKVPFFRSDLNSNDIATTADVLIEVLEQYKINQNIFFQYACCLYPTAPLVQVKELLEGFNLIKNHGFDSVFPIVAFSYPVWRSLIIDKDSRVKMQWPEYYNSRSQDLNTLYHDAGQWYWFKSEVLIREKKLYMNNSKGLILEETRVQDIDNMIDFKLAELKYKLINGDY